MDFFSPNVHVNILFAFKLVQRRPAEICSEACQRLWCSDYDGERGAISALPTREGVLNAPQGDLNG